MAVCPYLLLEEQGTSPFPFPSVSHRCHVTGTGVPVGQREQRTYCLVKHYTLCPFFPAQPAEATVLDTIPEAVAPAPAPTPAIELETIPEPLPPEMAPSPIRETLPDQPSVAGVVPEAPTPVIEVVHPPEAPVELVVESVAAGDLELAAAAEEPSVGIGSEAEAVASTRPAAKEGHLASIALRPLPRPPRQALIWAAVAGVCMVMLCVGALTAYGVAQLTRTGMPTIGAAELLPAVLLLLSVSSFAIAFILVVLLLWARQSALR
jgi:hypothetical protein